MGWRPPQPWQRSAGQAETAHALPANWRKLRDQVLREEPLCRLCQGRGHVTPATEVDHIVPRSQGGASARGNLQGLCGPCHRKKTQGEAVAGRGVS